jgi:hypothetical protein
MLKRLGWLSLCVWCLGCGEPAVDSALQLGKRQFHGGDFHTAVTTLTEAIAANPADAEAYVFRGRAYLCLGSENAGRAIADFNEAIRLDPNNYEAYYQRAIAHREKGDRKAAMHDENRARQLDPVAARFTRHTGTSKMPKDDEPESDESLPDLSGLPDHSLTPMMDSEPEFGDDGKPTRRDPTAMDAVDADGFPLEGDTPLLGPRGKPTKTPADAAGRAGGVAGLSSDNRGAPDDDRPAAEAPRAGTVTEQLFGRQPQGDASGGGAFGSGGLSRGAAPPTIPDWRSTPTPYASPMSPGEQPVHKRSPIGTLPFGNPFGSRAQSPLGPTDPAANPYLPRQPRSTGLGRGPVGRYDGSGYEPSYNPYNTPVVPRPQVPFP